MKPIYMQIMEQLKKKNSRNSVDKKAKNMSDLSIMK